MKHSKIILFSFLIASLLSSCVRYRDLVNYNEQPPLPEQTQVINNYEPHKIQPNDILAVEVSSFAQEAAAPFNTASGSGYLVDASGNITIPILGDVRLEDLTLEEAKTTLQTTLQPYFSEKPTVNVRLQNFKISVNGEVASGGIFTVPSTRITVTEAITRAGDFTPYSRRDSVLLIREFKNERTFHYLDFTTAEIFESPYFYMQQNDALYIKPSKNKVATVRDPATKILPFVSIVTSLTVLVVNIFR